MGKTIVISNQKGGCGKSVTAVNLAIGLVRQKGGRVLLLDADPQHSLTVSLGVTEPDKLPITLASVMADIIADTDFNPTAGITHHVEGVDFLPANITLANTELSLVPVMGHETVLRQYIDRVKPLYDWIICDTSPSLGLLTVNALAAADSIIITFEVNSRNISLRFFPLQAGESTKTVFLLLSAGVISRLRRSFWTQKGLNCC